MGQPYARDFGEIFRKYIIRWTTGFRLNPAIQPVVLFDDVSRLVKPLPPPRFMAGGLVPIVAGQATGMQLKCVVDTLVLQFGTQTGCWLDIDFTGALIFSWNVASTPIPRLMGDPLAKPQNILTIGGSTISNPTGNAIALVGSTITTPVFANTIAAPGNFNGIFVAAGGVFQVWDQGLGSPCPVGGIMWEEH